MLFRSLLSSLRDLDKKIEEMTNEEFLGSFSEKSLKNIDKLIGKRAKAHIYVYPPDIPIVRYGQIITKNMVEEIKSYIMKDCNVLGLKENGVFNNKIYYLMSAFTAASRATSRSVGPTARHFGRGSWMEAKKSSSTHKGIPVMSISFWAYSLAASSLRMASSV